MERYELAKAELEYARRQWGPSPQLDATLAFALNRMGDYRGGSVLMKRTYPQYMAAGGELLPVDVRRIIFPLAYWDLIREYSKARGLDPYLVSALIGQESAFDAGVKSRADAYGLMQILPSTGRRLARSEGIKRFRTSMLVDPRTNVRLGTRYFAGLIDRFGDVHLALAGYNAGESRVVRWTSEKPSLPDDEFIDDIPFPETQTYVKKIVGTTHDYRQLYGNGQAASLPLAREPAFAPLGIDLVPSVAAQTPPAPQARAGTGAARAKAPAKKPAKKSSASSPHARQRVG